MSQRELTTTGDLVATAAGPASAGLGVQPLWPAQADRGRDLGMRGVYCAPLGSRTVVSGPGLCIEGCFCMLEEMAA